MYKQKHQIFTSMRKKEYILVHKICYYLMFCIEATYNFYGAGSKLIPCTAVPMHRPHREELSLISMDTADIVFYFL